jgi:hypothetical protein
MFKVNFDARSYFVLVVVLDVVVAVCAVLVCGRSLFILTRRKISCT